MLPQEVEIKIMPGCPFRFSSLAFPFHMDLPMWLLIVFYFALPFITLTVETHGVHVSYRHLSTRSLFFLPAMSVTSTMCSRSLLIICSYHFSCFYYLRFDACVTLVVTLIYSFLIISLLLQTSISTSSSSFYKDD